MPDGEPTLDANLGQAIETLRPLGIKIAVISNGSLLWDEGVRDDLEKADWVSLKNILAGFIDMKGEDNCSTEQIEALI